MEDDDQDAKAELVAAAVTHLTSTTPSGAILVFLPGWDEIMSVLDLLGGKLRRSEVCGWVWSAGWVGSAGWACLVLTPPTDLACL